MTQSKVEKAYRNGYWDARPQNSVYSEDEAWERSATKQLLEEPKHKPLTDEDKRAISYFITEKGDITRWCSWKEKRDQVFVEFPELSQILTNHKAAEDTLNRFATDLREDYP